MRCVPVSYFPLRDGLCVSVLAAAFFAAGDADLEARVLPAAEAAFFPVTPEVFVCANALAAAFFAEGAADFDASVLPAAEAAFLPVRSFAINAPFDRQHVAARSFNCTRYALARTSGTAHCRGRYWRS